MSAGGGRPVANNENNIHSEPRQLSAGDDRHIGSAGGVAIGQERLQGRGLHCYELFNIVLLAELRS